MEPVRIFSTRADRQISKLSPVDPFTEAFCSLFNVSNKKFSEGGGMGEVLKFVTLDEVLRKKRKKKFCFFLQK